MAQPIEQVEELATAKPAATFGPELAQVLVITMWASTFIVTKAVFAEISPLAFIFVRFALMTILAFGVLAARGTRAQWHIRRPDLPRFLLVGLCGYTGYQLGFVLGLDNTSPFSSSLLIAMVPFFTLVILAVNGERARIGAWLGLGIGIAGVVLFLADKSAASGSFVGDALSLGAALSFAGYGVLNRRLTRDYPPETYTAYAVLLGSIPLLALSTPAALAQPWTSISVWGWLAIIYMVIFPVYVAYMLWNWAIARRGAAAATSFTLLVPIISGTLSAIFFGEGFSPLKLLGAAGVLVGLIILRRQARTEGSH